MKCNRAYNDILSENLMQYSPSYGIQATLLILDIVWKITVYIHGRRYTAVLIA